jgi:hypothetical protein
MITKELAKDILARRGICTISGGYGMGICAFAGMFTTRPLMGIWHESEVPTDQELEQIQSYQEFQIRSFYNPTWTEKLLAMKPPQDEAVNTLIFWKGFREQPGVWAYRRITWKYGPTFVDRKKNGNRLRTAEAMFDTIEDLLHDRFVKWKREHGGIFAPKVPTQPDSCEKAS